MGLEPCKGLVVQLRLEPSLLTAQFLPPKAAHFLSLNVTVTSHCQFWVFCCPVLFCLLYNLSR